jgi:hypothetical protein
MELGTISKENVQEELQMKAWLRIVVLILLAKVLLGFALRVAQSGSRQLQRTFRSRTIFDLVATQNGYM